MRLLNTEFFARLAERGGYIDKTAFLESLLKGCEGSDKKPNVFLFTRPRRFGKTLFLDMLQEFFDIGKDSRELFAGLKIAENHSLCARWMNRHPVIHMTLKDRHGDCWTSALHSIQSLVGNTLDLHREILESDRTSPEDRRIFQAHLDGRADENGTREALLLLSRVLCQHYGRRVVILIDEYEVPLVRAAEHGFLDRMLAFMRDFFGNALASSPWLEIAVLAGVLPFEKEDLFPGLDAMECHDVSSSRYADLFGFTQEEMDRILAGHGFMDKRESVRNRYRGYNFGGRTCVCNPWSIMQHMRALSRNPEKSPDDYWVDTGSDQPTRNFGDQPPLPEVHDRMAFLLAGRTVPLDLDLKLDYGRIFLEKANSRMPDFREADDARNEDSRNEDSRNEDSRKDDLWKDDFWKDDFWKGQFWKGQFWKLLYHSGYLTLSNDRTRCVEEPGERAVLAIPNRELRSVFGKELREWLQVLPDDCRTDFRRMFWKGDADALERLLGRCMRQCEPLADHAYGLFFYQALVCQLFWLDIAVHVDDTAEDRSFLVLDDHIEDVAAIICLMRADSENQLEAKARDALAQIEERAFEAPPRVRRFPKIHHWGMAFHRKSCGMCARIVRHSPCRHPRPTHFSDHWI